MIDRTRAIVSAFIGLKTYTEQQIGFSTG